MTREYEEHLIDNLYVLVAERHRIKKRMKHLLEHSRSVISPDNEELEECYWNGVKPQEKNMVNPEHNIVFARDMVLEYYGLVRREGVASKNINSILEELNEIECEGESEMEELDDMVFILQRNQYATRENM